MRHGCILAAPHVGCTSLLQQDVSRGQHTGRKSTDKSFRIKAPNLKLGQSTFTVKGSLGCEVFCSGWLDSGPLTTHPPWCKTRVSTHLLWCAGFWPEADSITVTSFNFYLHSIITLATLNAFMFAKEHDRALMQLLIHGAFIIMHH